MTVDLYDGRGISVYHCITLYEFLTEAVAAHDVPVVCGFEHAISACERPRTPRLRPRGAEIIQTPSPYDLLLLYSSLFLLVARQMSWPSVLETCFTEYLIA